ncbi:unnamed protein product, partial [Amoebophrya sp. A120]|eukprot:GSA120T00004494001.1
MYNESKINDHHSSSQRGSKIGIGGGTTGGEDLVAGVNSTVNNKRGSKASAISEEPGLLDPTATDFAPRRPQGQLHGNKIVRPPRGVKPEGAADPMSHSWTRQDYGNDPRYNDPAGLQQQPTSQFVNVSSGSGTTGASSPSADSMLPSPTPTPGSYQESVFQNKYGGGGSSSSPNSAGTVFTGDESGAHLFHQQEDNINNWM